MTTVARSDVEVHTGETVDSDRKCAARLMDCPNMAVWVGIYPIDCPCREIEYCDAHRMMIIASGARTWVCADEGVSGYGRVSFVPIGGKR